MNHLIFALTAPADKAVFERISAAYSNFETWTADLREKKIDVAHEVASYHRLQGIEQRLAKVQSVGAQAHDPLHHELRAQRIYFRVLLLNLLNLEDEWQAAEDAKAAAKAAKEKA